MSMPGGVTHGENSVLVLTGGRSGAPEPSIETEETGV
jgi:hypothetical protein